MSKRYTDYLQVFEYLYPEYNKHNEWQTQQENKCMIKQEDLYEENARENENKTLYITWFTLLHNSHGQGAAAVMNEWLPSLRVRDNTVRKLLE